MTGATTMDQALDGNIVSECKPSVSDPSERMCQLVDARIGDADTIPESTHVIFAATGHFDWFWIDMHKSRFEDAIRALNMAYGKPCKVNEEAYLNHKDRLFTGEKVRWCFKEGELELARVSERNANLSEVTYYPNKPQPKPTVYTANTL